MPSGAELDPPRRHALRLLRMVHELHKIGYQRVRIAPHLYPLAWRCSVTHAGNILKSHGARLRDYDRETAHHSGASGKHYFNWDDAEGDTVQQLAARFLERFPDIARLGQGQDWPYAGWYVQMLGFAERGGLPIAFGEYVEPDSRWLPTTEATLSGLPMPPGGEADPEREPGPETQ